MVSLHSPVDFLTGRMGLLKGDRVFWFVCSRQQMRHTAAPPPTRVRRRMERNRQKPVCQDKGILKEQQTKGTVTLTIQIRRKHRTNRTTQRAALHDRPLTHAPEQRVPSRPQLPPTGTQHDGTWYGKPCSVWPGEVKPPGCAPSWISVKISPVLAEPRTASFGDHSLILQLVEQLMNGDEGVSFSAILLPVNHCGCD